MNNTSIAGVRIPDSNWHKLPPNSCETPSPTFYSTIRPSLLFRRAGWAAEELKFDPELLYIGPCFTTWALPRNTQRTERFEVDSANAARDFCGSMASTRLASTWSGDAISLHTTPGIPRHKKPEVALVTAGVDMDVSDLVT